MKTSRKGVKLSQKLKKKNNNKQTKQPFREEVEKTVCDDAFRIHNTI